MDYYIDRTDYYIDRRVNMDFADFDTAPAADMDLVPVAVRLVPVAVRLVPVAVRLVPPAWGVLHRGALPPGLRKHFAISAPDLVQRILSVEFRSVRFPKVSPTDLSPHYDCCYTRYHS